jgi:hypothetical protein
LFDQVTDVLHRIFLKAQEQDYLLGISIAPTSSRILNLHFTDDTLLFFEATDQNVDILK